MRYWDARHLRAGDKITVKETGESKSVIQVEDIVRYQHCFHKIVRDIFITCNDGSKYHHTKIKL